MERGDPITIVRANPHRFERALFVGTEEWSRAYMITYTPVSDQGGPPRVGPQLDQEGVMWARGHSGPAVEALLVAEALR